MRLLTPPAPPPLTVQEVKDWARIDTAALDAEIQRLIRASLKMAEHECGKYFMAQTWRLGFANWPPQEQTLGLNLPSSVAVSYKLLPTDASFIALPTDAYVLVYRPLGFSVVPMTAESFPEIANELGDVRVQYDVAVGGDVLPEDVRLYMKTQCAWWIRNPEAAQDGKFVPGPFVEQMLHGEKVWWL